MARIALPWDRSLRQALAGSRYEPGEPHTYRTLLREAAAAYATSAGQRRALQKGAIPDFVGPLPNAIYRWVAEPEGGAFRVAYFARPVFSRERGLLRLYSGDSLQDELLPDYAAILEGKNHAYREALQLTGQGQLDGVLLSLGVDMRGDEPQALQAGRGVASSETGLRLLADLNRTLFAAQMEAPHASRLDTSAEAVRRFLETCERALGHG